MPETNNVQKSPVRLLVADDDPVLRSTIGKLYTRAGYLVTLSASGDQAVQLARKGIFDMVLIDLNIPERDGLGTLAALNDLAPDTPVVLLFAEGDGETYEKLMSTGSNRYLTKPLRQLSLLALVPDILGMDNDIAGE